MKATVADVAREARVSVATVDRVLNRRPGVRPMTVERVEIAVRKLNYQPDRLAARLARGREYRFCFVLPTGSNSFMQQLRREVEAAASRYAADRITISARLTDVFDPKALAGTLLGLGEEFDGIAVVALDHPRVREAIDRLAAAGISVVTLVSDMPGAGRAHYVGIDNSAAGRTAATLLGRFLAGRKGSVGVIAGSLGLRDHVERLYGFNQVLSSDFRTLSVLSPREARDDWRKVRATTLKLIEETPNLVGLYNAGAGNRGVVQALEETGRARDIVFIAHELTPHSRAALIAGAIDAVINQDAGHEVRSAVRVLTASVDRMPIVPEQERIRIDVFLPHNLP
ncbi:MAG: LacI family DNA-binding transcriptional regulator [Parvibaculaceae bacterium]